MYYEDEELCLQLWRAGARVVYLPTVEAQHVGGASSSDPAHVWPHLYRSLLRFQARHRPHTYGIVRSAILLRALLGVGIGMAHDFVAAARAERGRRARAAAVLGASRGRDVVHGADADADEGAEEDRAPHEPVGVRPVPRLEAEEAAVEVRSDVRRIAA